MRILAALFSVSVFAQMVDYGLYVKNGPNVNASAYNFTAQSPGGSLTATVQATVTLTGCPRGGNGSNTGRVLYVSGGVGTAEAVLITGGTCTGGASSGTVIFTPANSHSGAWTIRSATSGIKEAVNSISASGGEVLIDQPVPVLYQTLVIGNGSSSAASTRNNVTLRGFGAGSTPSETTTPSIATKLLWSGPAGGTMVSIEGPFNGADVRDLYFECNRTAATALNNNHVFNSRFSKLSFNGCTGYAIQQLAYSAPVGVVIGANNDIFSNIEIYADTVTSASCLLLGAAASSGPPHLNVAKNQFHNVNCGAGTAGVALNARFTDSSSFFNFNVSGAETGILVSTVTPNSVSFPQALVCYHCNIVATTLVNDSSWTSGILGMLFLPYNNDGDTILDQLGTNGWAAGIGTNMKIFGNWRYTPANYQSLSSSTPISNTAVETAFSKSYTITSSQLSRTGLTIRVTAAGKYSTTGAPTLTLYIKIGGTGINGNTIAAVALITPTGVTNYGWSATAEAVIRTTGLSGSVQVGSNYFGLGGIAGASGATSGSFTMATNADQTVYVTAQWGTASALNTITMDSLRVDLLHPGTAN